MNNKKELTISNSELFKAIMSLNNINWYSGDISDGELLDLLDEF